MEIKGEMFSELVAVGQAMNLVPFVFLSHRENLIANIVSQLIGKRLDSSISQTMESLQLAHGFLIEQLGTPRRDVLWDATFQSGIPHLEFLGPPVANCYACDSQLSTHNPPVTVLCYEWNGPVPALKITLRCDKCGLNYR